MNFFRASSHGVTTVILAIMGHPCKTICIPLTEEQSCLGVSGISRIFRRPLQTSHTGNFRTRRSQLLRTWYCLIPIPGSSKYTRYRILES